MRTIRLATILGRLVTAAALLGTLSASALIAADICTPMIARILPSICEQNGTLIPCTAELADELRDERDRIDRRIGELVESKRALDLAIEAAPKRRLRGQNVST